MMEELEPLFDAIESALTLAGYEVMDGGSDWLIIRDGAQDIDYRITIQEEL